MLPFHLLAQVKPIAYWSFDEMPTTHCKVTQVKGVTGSAIDLNNTNCLLATPGLPRVSMKTATIEFWFKGDRFQFLSFPDQHFQVQFSMNGLLFRTTSKTSSGKNMQDDLLIRFNGAERQSYAYYTDQQWHHFVFVLNTETGMKKIWIDGLSPQGFSRQIPKAPALVSNNFGFRFTSGLDELKFYQKALAEKELNTGTASSASVSQQSLDTLEFAPGYPAYTIQAKDQLRRFPKPRFYTSVPLKRNMSWMDIQYLHRELPTAGGKGFGATNPATAVQLLDQLAKDWNYYVELPVFRSSASYSNKQYSDSTTVAGALIRYANRHPEFPYALLSFQAQNKPAHVLSQNLPSRYYLSSQTGEAVKKGRSKLLSPLMPLDIIQKDAIQSATYISWLLPFLKTAPFIINENGEVFGHFISEKELKQDARVWDDFKKTGLTAPQYSGRFQYRRDSTYKATLLKAIGHPETRFSFYNVSAIQPAYWPDYAKRRKLNSWSDSLVLPTPDFYPATPDNWFLGRGALNGFGNITEGRKTEIQYGDKFFAPFVAAGWSNEEKNIRPAQWLALLKSMVMLGADFFYVGYFNLTGRNGAWPNGAGPNDPRGYIYQAALPAYAQALRTWVPGFFTEGELLDPGDFSQATYSFRFKGNADNELILVRKWKHQYLIYGSIQPLSNIKGNIPNEWVTTIRLEGKPVSFTIRRQGSLYVYDPTASTPVFYQLDKWHQYEHPWFWSTDIELDAVNFAQANRQVKRVNTNRKGSDFSSSSAHLECRNGASITYEGLALQPGNYELQFDLLFVDKETLVQVQLPETRYDKMMPPDKSVLIKVEHASDRLVLDIKNGSLQFKQIRLIRK